MSQWNNSKLPKLKSDNTANKSKNHKMNSLKQKYMRAEAKSISHQWRTHTRNKDEVTKLISWNHSLVPLQFQSLQYLTWLWKEPRLLTEFSNYMVTTKKLMPEHDMIMKKESNKKTKMLCNKKAIAPFQMLSVWCRTKPETKPHNAQNKNSKHYKFIKFHLREYSK